jgi:hypothetical protein
MNSNKRSSQHLIDQRYDLKFRKLKDINEFIVSILDRILIVTNTLNNQIKTLSDKINNITLLILRLELSNYQTN